MKIQPVSLFSLQNFSGKYRVSVPLEESGKNYLSSVVPSKAKNYEEIKKSIKNSSTVFVSIPDSLDFGFEENLNLKGISFNKIG